MNHFHFYTKQDILSLTKLRRFETRLGERVIAIFNDKEWEAALHETTARYILVGIPEDIGVKANSGIGGADSSWMPFLSAFLNTQSNDFLDGEEIMAHARQGDELLEAYRQAVNIIDDEVETLSKLIAATGKIPIFIGGGHNNAYPIIKGAAKGLLKAGLVQLAQINCINVDAHTDFRPVEGRHSGNAFRYAEEDGYMQKYCMVGLHESYLQQNVWIDIVNNPFLDCITYEDIFVHEKRNFHQAVSDAISFTEDNYTGIELDLDSIEGVLSSAMTPCGISAIQARQYMSLAGARTIPAYLHICEGATQLADGRSDGSTGKLISYLVADFVKAVEGK
jgi:formiminoglutamase